jgi:hypothetical protein
MISTFCADELRWRPFELTSVADVERLNALFAEGWRIEPIDIEGLPFLAFCGREGDTGWITPRSARSREQSHRLLLILQRAAVGQKAQRAVFVERGSGGYIDMRGERPRAGGRRFVALFPIGHDATVSIYDQ